MSEAVQPEVADASAQAATASAGALLRAAREGQGLHIGALAVALKVPVKKIEALEADRLQELPDMVFVRSMAMSICRVLKINPQPVLALLPEALESRLKPMDGGLNTQFRDTTLASQGAWRNQLLSPIGLGTMALLVTTVAIWVWRSPASDVDQSVKTVVSGETASDNAAVPALTAASTLTLAPTNQAVVPASADVALASSSAPVSAEPQVLELKSKGVSWVEVNDADGVSLLRKLTAAGEVLQVSGKLPLSVVLGRADQLDVAVRGRPFDVSGVARENVARFEVK